MIFVFLLKLESSLYQFLNPTQLALVVLCFRNFGLQPCVIKQTTVRSERGLSTILHCLQWYKLVLHTRLSTAAVQCLILTTCDQSVLSFGDGCGRRFVRSDCWLISRSLGWTPARPQILSLIIHAALSQWPEAARRQANGQRRLRNKCSNVSVVSRKVGITPSCRITESGHILLGESQQNVQMKQKNVRVQILEMWSSNACKVC